MNLPDAFLGLAQMASTAFGAPFYAGAIISQATPGGYDDNGVFHSGLPPAETPCTVQIDAIDERARPQGWSDKDYRFIILASGLPAGLRLDTDASVKVTDAKAPDDFRAQWLVSSLQRDPAGIGWVGKGQLA